MGGCCPLDQRGLDIGGVPAGVTLMTGIVLNLKLPCLLTGRCWEPCNVLMTQVSKFIIWFWLSTNVNYFQIGRTVSPVMREMLCDIDWGTRTLLGQMNHTGLC